jgi:hypothetical protein
MHPPALPDDAGSHRVRARARGGCEYTSPVKLSAGRSPDAAIAASVRKILCAWYGNLNAAADALGVDRRDLWRWCVGREPMPARVIAAMTARVYQAEARRRRELRARLALEEAKIADQLARLPQARRELESVVAAMDAAPDTLRWSRLGYVPTERARLIRQEDRRRAMRRPRDLRQL